MNAADDSMLEAVPGFPWPNPAARLILTKLYLQCTHRIIAEIHEGIICELSIVASLVLRSAFLGNSGLPSCLR